MATVKEKSGRPMATEVVVRDDDEPGDKPPRGPQVRAGSSGGFFSIYKKGQGYWTRMGTAGAAALIVALFVYNFFQYLPTFGIARREVVIISIVFAILVSLIAFWLMNRPTNAEFLIATDSEMKKVNWTSKQELIGSTKVVVIFMFLIAFILFAVDLAFQTFFWLIDVLRIEPFYVPYLREWSGHLRHWLGW
jgi:preprotein translocase subunit SecE